LSTAASALVFSIGRWRDRGWGWPYPCGRGRRPASERNFVTVQSRSVDRDDRDAGARSQPGARDADDPSGQ